MIFVVQPTTQVDGISYIPDVWEDDLQLSYLFLSWNHQQAEPCLISFLAHYQ